MLKDLTIPTLLIEGACDQAQEFATQALCGYFCRSENSSDCFCVDCRRIKQRQHPSFLWICPEKDYTIDEVDVIFEKVRFTLEDNEKYFFVLEKAQTFNAATANRLLKLLEEPPRGYVFILLTTNKNAILPTIISRSHIINLGACGAIDSCELHPIADCLISAHKLDDPVGFELELKKHKLTDREAVQLCFDMLEYIAKKLAVAKKQAEQDHLMATIDTIKEHLRSSPGSGSADFFLKRLFLYMPRG